MAKKRRIYFDKAEVVCLVPTKKGLVNYNLTNRDFSRIQIEKCNEYIFRVIPVKSEKISIYSSKVASAIVYTKRENALFDTYKEELRQYAKEYHVPISDNTVEEE